MPTYTRTAETPESAPNTSGTLVEVNPGDSIQTYKVLGTGWTKTSDEPYFALGRIRGSITSPGTVSGLSTDRFLQVLAGADGITVTANAAANPNVVPLQKNVPYFIDNTGGEVGALVFVGAGSVTVVGLDR